MSTLVCEAGFESKDNFLEHERNWVSSLLPGKWLSVRFQWYFNASGFKVLLWCNSCSKCQSKSGWKGYSTYNSETKTLERAYTPLAAHGDPTALKTSTPLTSTTERALKQFVAVHAHFTTQDLVKIVEEHQEDRPSDSWLQRWGRNHRVHKAKTDWQQLIRDLGTTDELHEVCDGLRNAAASFDPSQTVVVFCNPRLLADTLKALENKSYIKLCGDGTFLLTDGEWILLTLGAVSKHNSAQSNVYAFRTTFNPLLFALTQRPADAALFTKTHIYNIYSAYIHTKPHTHSRSQEQALMFTSAIPP